jgi:hypothetical protein
VEVADMVDEEIKTTTNSISGNQGRHDSWAETEHREIVIIPLWFLRIMLGEDLNNSLTLNQLDMAEGGPPIQIPKWLFKSFLKQDKDVPLTVTQVASMLGVHPKTVQKWSRLGIIKIHSRSSRGNLKFLISDVINSLVNTPRLQRLFQSNHHN